MSENVSNATNLPKRSFFNKTTAIRVGVAALAVAIAVVVVKLKLDSHVELVAEIAKTA